MHPINVGHHAIDHGSRPASLNKQFRRTRRRPDSNHDRRLHCPAFLFSVEKKSFTLKKNGNSAFQTPAEREEGRSRKEAKGERNRQREKRQGQASNMESADSRMAMHCPGSAFQHQLYEYEAIWLKVFINSRLLIFPFPLMANFLLVSLLPFQLLFYLKFT